MTKSNENTRHNKEKNKNNQTYPSILSSSIKFQPPKKLKTLKSIRKILLLSIYVYIDLRMSIVKTSMFTANIFSKH